MATVQKRTEKNLMASTWTKAAKIRRAFKAGRPPTTDTLHETEVAVLLSRQLFIEIRAAMMKEGIVTGKEDVKVALTLMSPEGKSGAVFFVDIPRDIEELPKAYWMASELAKREGVVPLGVSVWLRDRENDTEHAWVQPWLVNPRARRAAEAASEAFAATKGDEEPIGF